MNDQSLDYLHKSVNMIAKSLGMPAIGETLQSAADVDAHNEELYDRDDDRQFHVPVFQLRNSFYTVMAKTAADAEAIVHQRLQRERPDAEGTTQVGPAVDA